MKTTAFAVNRLLESTFGTWTGKALESFPIPLPPREAGGHSSGQRRYLWTDAFGVLAFCSQARTAKAEGLEDKRAEYLTSATRLSNAVLSTLGTPRSEQFPMQPCNDEKSVPGFTSPHYLGLRIGKLEAAKTTDMGMRFDGMYWHYCDKFIFALLRQYAETGDAVSLSQATHLIHTLHRLFFVPKQGYRWKINVDGSPIPGDRTSPNHDAVSAWAVYRVAKVAGADVDAELGDLLPIAKRYFERPLSLHEVMDPLGFGTQLWTMQWCSRAVLGPGVDEHRKTLLSFVDRMLNICGESELRFRAYGALLGLNLYSAQLSAKQNETLHALLAHFVKVEEAAPQQEDHSSINKAMLAAALNPIAFAARPDEL
jgi:hypothetical protein